MRVVAAILCAGRGVRFGGDKLALRLHGKPVWRWSYAAYANHPGIDRTILVGNADNLDELAQTGEAILGGETRQASARAALEATDAEILVFHDGARPFVSSDLITRVVEATRRDGAAAAALPVTDTIKEVGPERVRTLDRSRLWAMQTPQAARTELLREAHARATAGATDDMALLEAIGVVPTLVPGDPQNMKITTPADLARLGMGEARTGMGYDVHAFSADPSRVLMLGGVAFPDHPALEGHSDADALLHAATDALLGAAALGDIGVHFPPSDERWRGMASLHFLGHAAALLANEGWTVVNLDLTVIAESPKVMKRALEVRTTVAGALGIEVGRVSLKATTNEGMGFVGRKEGIAALAVATVRR